MKDDIVFALYKDEPLNFIKRFQYKVKRYVKEINVTEVYRRIHNYQIEKYGSPLSIRVELGTRYDGYEKARLARQRRYERKNRK